MRVNIIYQLEIYRYNDIKKEAYNYVQSHGGRYQHLLLKTVGILSAGCILMIIKKVPLGVLLIKNIHFY